MTEPWDEVTAPRPGATRQPAQPPGVPQQAETPTMPLQVGGASGTAPPPVRPTATPAPPGLPGRPGPGLPGYYAPPPGIPGAVLWHQYPIRIGDLLVTESAVETPSGSFPLRGSRWEVTDQWLTDRQTPPWAIALALVLACPTGMLSLLLLFIREDRYHGMVQVTVNNGPHHYVTHIPAVNRAQVVTIHQLVDRARALASR